MTDEVTHISERGLQRLFEGCVGEQQHRLAPRAGGLAVKLRAQGFDPGSIGMSLGVEPSAVATFFAALDQADADKRARHEAREAAAASMAEVAATVEAHAATTSPPPPPPAPQKPARQIAPDVELTRLQAATIRRLRKFGIPAAVLGMALRVSVDQIMRICEEAP